MLYYILQTIAFQLFFLAIYDVFLKQETFFNWNRAYLLITSVLSITLPFIKIDRFSEVIPQEYIVNLPQVVIGSLSEQNMIPIDVGGINSENTLIWSWELLFYIGMGMTLIMLLTKLIKLAIVIKNNPKRWKGDFILVRLIESSKAFSFFHYIFLGEKITHQDRVSILKHEQVHAEQKHTLDLLYFELLRIIFWFNPLIYMYQNRIAELHEFIADAKAVKLQDKANYYENMLSQVFETQHLSFINPFFKKSLIKKRIVMLSKQPSQQKQLLKYALLIPTVLCMLLYTSANGQQKASKENSQPEHKAPVKAKALGEKEVPFAVIQQVPIYPGCEGLSQKEQKNCMTKKIASHVSANFNTKLGNSLGLTGSIKIRSVFKVNKQGDIEGIRVRAPHPELEKEAIRIIKGLPKMTPGMHKNKPVIVPYSLPIVFEIKGKQGDKVVIKTASYKVIEEHNEVPFLVVEQPPVYPGCINVSNQGLRDCISKSISQYVAKNFNTKLAKDLGLVGRQKISVMFKVNREGNIEGIKARAPHPELKKEASRVISGLPKMKPGKQKGKTVTVPYSLPIIFQVHSDDKKSDDKN